LKEAAATGPAVWCCRESAARVKGGTRRIGRSYLWLPDDADISSGDSAGGRGTIAELTVHSSQPYSAAERVQER
jgi:hypothetical protein